jgi:hypothetical protein
VLAGKPRAVVSGQWRMGWLLSGKGRIPGLPAQRCFPATGVDDNKQAPAEEEAAGALVARASV